MAGGSITSWETVPGDGGDHGSKTDDDDDIVAVANEAEPVASCCMPWAAPMIRWEELPEYRPPLLVSARVPALVWRVAVAIGAAGAVMLWLALQRQSPDMVGVARWSTVVGGVTACLAGGWWCHVRARNVHLLEAQQPTETRAIRAWLWPLVWVLIAMLTVRRFDPTEPIDVRPAIIAIGFVLAAWRPFSLIRRIFASLSLERYDELVVSMAAIQIFTWLLLWWQLVRVDMSDEGVDVGSSGAIAGVTAGCALAFVVTIRMIALGHRAADRAEGLRVLALQTRAEHRYLRSLGLNPFDSRVFDVLILAKLQRENSLRRTDDEDAPHVDVGPATTALQRAVDSTRRPPPENSPTRIRQRQTDVVARLRHRLHRSETATKSNDSPDVDQPDRSAEDPSAATVDARTPADVQPVDPPAAGVGDEIGSGPRTAVSAGELPDDGDGAEGRPRIEGPNDPDDLVDERGALDPASLPRLPERARAPSDHDDPWQPVSPAKRTKWRGVRAADTPTIPVVDYPPQDDDHNPLQPVDDQELGDGAQPIDYQDRVDEREPIDGAQPVDEHELGDEQPVDDQEHTDEQELVHDRESGDRQPVDDHKPGDEQDPVRDEQQIDDVRPMVYSRLDGSGPPGENESHDLWNRDFVHDDPDRNLQPARLAAAEGSRLLALCGIVALALCLDWGVVVALDLREPIRGGLIAGADLDRLNRVRRWVNIVLMLSLGAQALWAFTVSLWANRAGVGNSRPVRCLRLADVTVLCVAGGLAALLNGMTPIIPALFVLVASALAWLAVMSVVPVAEWAEVPVTSIRVWATGQVLVTLVHLATGGIDDIPADASIEWVAFLGVALGLVAAVTAIVAGIASLEIEDSLRGSTKIAAWVATKRNDQQPPSTVEVSAPTTEGEHHADAALDGPRLATVPSMAESERSADHGSRIDINAGSTEELAQVPGIGVVTAQRIVDHRESSGTFDSVSDLSRVAGLGRRKIEQLAPYLVAGVPEPGDRPR